jgi:hypothetical protein
MTWPDFSATFPGGGHVQVTAVGAGNARCVSVGWAGNTAYVRCYGASGAPADSAYSIAYWRPTPADPGMAFAWANDPSASSYTPNTQYSFASGGGSITATRSGTGVYQMQWTGMGGIGINGGHAQVTAYGSADVRCKVWSWGPSSVSVRCHDTAGSPADTPYNVLFLKPAKKAWLREYAFSRGSEPSQTVPYHPDYSAAYNQPGGYEPTYSLLDEREDVEIVRVSTGVYTVYFDRFGLYADGGNVQVTAQASDGSYCKVEHWGLLAGPDADVTVRCFGATGAPSDSYFHVLYVKSSSGPSAIAYAWANLSNTASYAPHPDYAWNPTGGAVTATRTGTGLYTMTWSGFGALGVDGGHPKVTAYGSGNARCQIQGWGGDSVNVRCYDAAGNLVDSRYSVLFVRPDADADGLAFAWGNDSTAASYTPSAFYSFNAGGGAVTAERFETGYYKVEFDEFHWRGLLLPHVHVTSYGSSDRRCAVSSWWTTFVQVRCHDAAGSPADTRFNVMFLKPVMVPEPAAASMLGAGAALLGLLARRRAQTRRSASTISRRAAARAGGNAPSTPTASASASPRPRPATVTSSSKASPIRLMA